MLKVKVENMYSSNGNAVPNQFVITTDDKEYFQSYDTVIAARDRSSGKITLDEDKWAYSVTTGKYRNAFLGENIRETRIKIDAHIYKLANLN